MQNSPGTRKTVYLMRGLPCCGKSHTAGKLAGESGIVCETDEYFYAHVGHDPARYDYQKDLLPAAREWNYQRFTKAVRDGRSPIVVDRGNGLNTETRRYAAFAVEHDYCVELAEPESEWWQEIRVLLKYKSNTRPVLCDWARRLAEMSRADHRVPQATIQRWMDHWRWDVTVDDILNYESSQT